MRPYKTRNLYFSSFLSAKNIPLLSIEQDPQNRFYWFVFQGFEKCLMLENAYWNGQELIEPLTFVESIKTLKDRLFSYKKINETERTGSPSDFGS